KYDIFTEEKDGSTRIVGKDTVCQGKSGDALADCLAKAPPAALKCSVEVCKPGAQAGDYSCKGSISPDEAAATLSANANVQTSVKIKSDPGVPEVLRRAATDPQAAQALVKDFLPSQQRVLQAAIPEVIASNQSL